MLFFSDDNTGSSSDGEHASTSKERWTLTDSGETFSKQDHLVRHERKHKEQKEFSYKICNISFPTFKERTLHSKEHRVKKEFRCEQCGKDFFNTLYRMRAHINTHEEKSLQCNVCNKFFHNNSNLSDHKRIHTGEKPYTVGTESIQTPLHFSLFVILQPFAKII